MLSEMILTFSRLGDNSLESFLRGGSQHLTLCAGQISITFTVSPLMFSPLMLLSSSVPERPSGGVQRPRPL